MTMTPAAPIPLGMALALLAVTGAAQACPTQAPAPALSIHDPLPDLDRIEDRLVAARAIVAHWRAVAAHTEPRLRGCSDQALTRRPR